MELTGTASAEFSASHVVKDHPLCGRLHGHRWRCEVTIAAGQDPATGELVGLPELALAVETFANELHREHVNDMLPASPPTGLGVAFALRERLSLQFQNIVRVDVWADETMVTVRA